MVKRLPAMRETQVQSLDWEDLLEEEMATHSSILAWRIPWTEEPGRLQSMGSQRVGHDWVTSLINYQKDTVVNQIIFQIINSRFSIWLLFFIQPDENLGVKSLLGQWLLLSLVHQNWVSFKMKICCLLYDSSKIFTNTTFFIGTDYGTKDAIKQIAVIFLTEKHFQFSKIFKMLFCKLVIKINSQPQHRRDCKMLVMKCISNTIAGFKCFRS